MSIPDRIRAGAHATNVGFRDASLVVTLFEGWIISAPLEWFPRLRDALPDPLSRWELIPSGEGIHWPELDEDVSVVGLRTGERSTFAFAR
jgi:hypothetical protein